MKKFTVVLIGVLLPIALGSLTDKPTVGNPSLPSSSSVKPIPAFSKQPLWAHPRIITDDSLRDLGVVGSANWSGYAATNLPNSGPVTGVIGTWTVPAVSGSSGYSAVWVGIDGFDDGTVEQLGTMQAVVSQGRKTAKEYYAWVEMYPAPMQELPYSVAPGDKITASVAYNGATFTVSMTDVGKWTYMSQPIQVTANEMSAEWVVEAPSSQSGILPLADFGTVNFTGCGATISGATGPIGIFNWDEVIMETGTGKRATVKALPSPLDSTGSAFTVAWEHN
jgi:peptidase A4-like protein